MRIFQIAKELNISHKGIIAFLETKGVKVGLMDTIDDQLRQLILNEFSKDKETVDRFRKEQVRKEIHDTKVRQKQKEKSKLKLLSLQDQRSLEQKEQERIRSSENARKKKEAESKEKEDLEKRKISEQDKKKEENIKTKTSKNKKRKMRKIEIADIESEIGQLSRKKQSREKVVKNPEEAPKNVKEMVKKTLAEMGGRSKKKVYRKEKDFDSQEIQDVTLNKLEIREFSNVDEIAKLLKSSPSEIIQKCIGMGVLATMNQRLEWDVIELLAEDYGYTAEKISDISDEMFSIEDTKDDLQNAKSRAPVVTIMGHVDHGKTSLLDYIRKTNIVAGESGGITQHIGAYKVELEEGKYITFLDTPGHEAFTAMRARGAQVTDLVILVVAADDAVMPQTIEAINHARSANVPIIVAINKVDKPGSDIDKVKRELSDNGVLVEDWGGNIQSVPVSAKTGEGIEDIISSILLESEMLELKSNFETLGRGTVIDSRLDKGHGPMATVLIRKGTIRVGDPFLCNDYSGKIRAIMNERGQRIKEAFPSDAVQVLGFDQVPQVSDIIAVVKSEKDLKRMSSDRQRIRREIDLRKITTHTLDEMSSLIKEGNIKSLPLIIKGDVDGSVEALSETLGKIMTDEVQVKVIHQAVGMVTESDVLLAEASSAVIIGFNVQVSSNAKLQGKQTGVDIRTYSIIYDAVEEVKMALEGLLEPELKEKITGKALVQAQFKIPKLGFIAGSKVSEGIIKRNDKARLIRNDEIIIDNCDISSLKRFQEDVKEVKEGLECGIGLSDAFKYEEGDIIEVFEVKEIKRKLEIT
ncbi:MAG: translation initiation factor IF-2 [Candidatus Marinimicrobia bacterium]|nr:translation initiation factor IF-2 [Candidatus Neomarinimicrobiota bacterium]|tara:strand:- start:34924 stop:37347 length:2424 start_codon:yes stop_codon:yes gene_type:complete